MSLYTLGLNHTTAPLDVRARVAFAPDALSGALRDLTSSREVKEAAILSTCNRTEVYFHGGEPEGVARWLEKTHTLTPATLSPYLYTQIAFATLAGWLVFSHAPDAYAVAGILVIAGCGIAGTQLRANAQRARGQATGDR